MALPRTNRRSASTDQTYNNHPRLQIIATGWRRLFNFLRPAKTFEQITSISSSMIIFETKRSVSLQRPLLINIFNRHQQLSGIRVIACRRVETATGFQYHLKVCFEGLTALAQDGGSNVLNQFSKQL